MSSPNDPEQKWLAREWLPVKRIINVARGASPAEDLSNLPPDWAAIFTDLKAYIELGEIKSISHSLKAFAMIRADGFWKFLSREHVPKGLPDAWSVAKAFCRRWAQNHGIDLGKLTPEARKRGSRTSPASRQQSQEVINLIRADIDDDITERKVLHWFHEQKITAENPRSFGPDFKAAHLNDYGIAWFKKDGKRQKRAYSSLHRYYVVANGKR